VKIERAKWVLADALVVVLFVVVGTRNHDEDTGFTSTIGVMLPFIIGVLIAWVPWKIESDTLSNRMATRVWITTVVAGVLLRRFAWDRSTAGTFVIVATAFLFACFFGWRAVTRKLQQR
jgi:Protein of unknown function (DUF3054)